MFNRMPGQPDEAVLHDNLKDRFQLINWAETDANLVDELRNEELIPWLEATEDPWLQNL
jgi:hypothetical protein